MEYETVIKCFLSQHHKKGQVHFTKCAGVTVKRHWGNLRQKLLSLGFIDDLQCVYLIVDLCSFSNFCQLKKSKWCGTLSHIRKPLKFGETVLFPLPLIWALYVYSSLEHF